MKLTGVAVLIALIAGAAGHASSKAPVVKQYVEPKQPAISAIQEKPQLDYLNAIRTQHGLPALTEDSRLDASAKAKADDLIALHYWAHDNPQGRPFYSWILDAVPNLHRYGENLGKCQPNEQILFQAFTDSPEHLQNMVDPTFSIFGSAAEWDNTLHCEIYVNQFGGF